MMERVWKFGCLVLCLWLCQLQADVTSGQAPPAVGTEAGRPIDVQLNCSVDNWESMTCTWEYRNITHDQQKQIKTRLTWSILKTIGKCPNRTRGKSECVWPKSTFHAQNIYYIDLTIIDKTSGVILKNFSKEVRTKEIVKPAPVYNLNLTTNGTHCITVKWDHSDITYKKVAALTYYSRCQAAKVQEIDFLRGPQRESLCGLLPDSTYNVTVTVQAKTSRFNSEPITLSIRTENLTESHEERLPGFYSISNNSVLVYWKSFPECNRIVEYEVHHLESLNTITSNWTSAEFDLNGPRNTLNTVMPSTNLEISNTLMSNGTLGDINLINEEARTAITSVRLAMNRSTDNHLRIYPILADGTRLSPQPWEVVVPSEDKAPQGQTFVLAETDLHIKDAWSGLVNISWGEDVDDDDDGDGDNDDDQGSMVVVWCLGDMVSHRCAGVNESLKWQEVPSNTTHYRLNLRDHAEHRHGPTDYIIGVVRRTVRHGDVTLSPITWADCYYPQNTPRVPGNVSVVTAGSDAVSVTWTPRVTSCSDTHIADEAFTSYYVVSYSIPCSGSDPCKAEKRVSGNKHSVMLKGLVPDTNYSIRVAAFTTPLTALQSVPSPVLTVKTNPDAQQVADSSVPLALVVGILCVLVAPLLVGFIIYRVKRCVKKADTKFSNSLFTDGFSDDFIIKMQEEELKSITKNQDDDDKDDDTEKDLLLRASLKVITGPEKDKDGGRDNDDEDDADDSGIEYPEISGYCAVSMDQSESYADNWESPKKQNAANENNSAANANKTSAANAKNISAANENKHSAVKCSAANEQICAQTTESGHVLTANAQNATINGRQNPTLPTRSQNQTSPTTNGRKLNPAVKNGLNKMNEQNERLNLTDCSSLVVSLPKKGTEIDLGSECCSWPDSMRSQLFSSGSVPDLQSKFKDKNGCFTQDVNSDNTHVQSPYVALSDVGSDNSDSCSDAESDNIKSQYYPLPDTSSDTEANVQSYIALSDIVSETSDSPGACPDSQYVPLSEAIPDMFDSDTVNSEYYPLPDTCSDTDAQPQQSDISPDTVNSQYVPLCDAISDNFDSPEVASVISHPSDTNSDMCIHRSAHTVT